MRSSPYSALSFRRSRASFSSSAIEDTPHIYGRRIFAEIHGLDGHQDAHLRHNLNHPSTPHKLRLSATKSTTSGRAR